MGYNQGWALTDYELKLSYTAKISNSLHFWNQFLI